ncbi:NifU N-terminal domain-containing protein [Aquamicrobium segne]|uniref:NifU N-terminal domain-containing protein n=1 Tax=Aquamicrobium segne TaxID=469547 RepID=A0ABW0GWC8_9HYPH
MFIQTEATDNPSQLRFLPGQTVTGTEIMEFADKQAASVSPLATRLFEIDGVSALSFGPDWILITRQKGEWQHLKPPLLGIIMEHFMSGAPILYAPARAATPRLAGEENILAEEIRTALHRVIDPELGYNIVDLGLIYDVIVGSDGDVLVQMTTTTPGCPATNYLMEGSRECAASVEGVGAVEVELTYEPRWSPEMMSEEAKAHFGIVA